MYELADQLLYKTNEGNFRRFGVFMIAENPAYFEKKVIKGEK